MKQTVCSAQGFFLKIWVLMMKGACVIPPKQSDSVWFLLAQLCIKLPWEGSSHLVALGGADPHPLLGTMGQWGGTIGALGPVHEE